MEKFFPHQPYTSKYRVQEVAPGVYQAQYSKEERNIFTGKIIGEHWRPFGSYGGMDGDFHPTTYQTIASAQEGLKKFVANIEFVEKTVSLYP